MVNKDHREVAEPDPKLRGLKVLVLKLGLKPETVVAEPDPKLRGLKVNYNNSTSTLIIKSQSLIPNCGD